MPPFPRELNLDPDTKARLISYLDEELTNHYAERNQYIENLKRWQNDYWAPAKTEKATFPFTGAATITIPLTAIAIEAVHARSMTTLFGAPGSFVSVTAVSSEWDSAAPAMERFLDRELLVEMKFRNVINDCFLEAEKFGTMFAKSGYEKLVKTAIREEGGIEQEFDVTVKQGACVDAVPGARFIMPFAYLDPQTSPWVGEEHEASPYKVIMMENGGMFRPGTIATEDSALRAWINRPSFDITGTETGRQFKENQEKLEKTQPQWPKTINWVEIWMAFDVDGSGREKEIVVHYHRESQTLMSVRYNWNDDLRRPYRRGVYMPVEHRWYGIGICKQNEQFQREVTTQHRQRLDNATLANMRMFKINKLSGYGPKEPIFPGKMWFLDDLDHLDTVQLAEVYPSSYSNEQATLIYSQQRTGVNETVLGMPQVGTPGTATSDLARIQEGNKKFDYIYANYKEFVNELISDVAANIQQFGPKRVTYFDTSENGQLVRSFFEMPNEHVRSGLLLQLRASGQQQNDVLDRQNWVQVAQLLQQYFMGLIQLAMPMGDPNLLQTIFTRGLGAATEAMRQILETYNIRNIDRLIVKELESGTPRIGPTTTGSGTPAAPGIGGASEVSPMELIAQAFGQVGANGNGRPNQLQGRY